MSNKPTPSERKELTAELRKKHQPIFDALDISEAIFIPKMAHYVKGLDGLHMGFFESELKHGEDVYTEMVSMQIESEDPERRLFRFRHNPHFREELPTSDSDPTPKSRYYVPLDDLELVTTPEKEDKPKKIKTVIDSNEDLPMDAMTIKDYIAIHTGKPVSDKQWINELIS